MRGPLALRLHRPERMASRRLTSLLFGKSLVDLLLFPEPFCFWCWGFGGNLSEGKEECGPPGLIGGVLDGVGFTQGVPECMRSLVCQGNLISFNTENRQSDPVNKASVRCMAGSRSSRTPTRFGDVRGPWVTLRREECSGGRQRRGLH